MLRHGVWGLLLLLLQEVQPGSVAGCCVRYNKVVESASEAANDGCDLVCGMDENNNNVCHEFCCPSGGVPQDAGTSECTCRQGIGGQDQDCNNGNPSYDAHCEPEFGGCQGLAIASPDARFQTSARYA